jgi:putative FmdB family regulatory protein
MPVIYEYACSLCGHRWEETVTIGSPTPCSCPLCPGKPERIYTTAPTIAFRGKGFYSTDSVSKKGL